MGDHLALLVNRLLTESTLHAAIESRNRAKEAQVEVEEEGGGKTNVKLVMSKEGNEELSSLRKLVECRICQDEDFDSNLETPCSCCGSLKVSFCNSRGINFILFIYVYTFVLLNKQDINKGHEIKF